MNQSEYRFGDVLIFKKPHPCGSARWKILRAGADLKLQCEGCGRTIMLERWEAEKRIRAIEKTP